MIITEQKESPKEKRPSLFKKEEALQIFTTLEVSGGCFTFCTENIKSWKANFYAIRRNKFPDHEYTFAMDKEKTPKGYYNVWRIK